MSALPANYILDSIRKLRGKPRVTFPGQSDDVLKIERIFTEPKSSEWRTKYPYGAADPEFAGTTLIIREQTGEDAQYVEIYLAYHTLPGVSLGGYAMTSQFGGGILETTEQLVADGEEITVDEKTVAIEVIPNGDGTSTLRKSVLPASESWPELREPEYVDGMGIFVDTLKKVVANTGQAGTVTGGTGSADRVLTEYNPIDKWKTIQITSKVQFADIGSQVVFSKPIQYSIPAEIAVEPSMIQAYSGPTMQGNYDAAAKTGMTQAEYEAYVSLWNAQFVTDAELDYTLQPGRRGSFTAEVTRTLSMTTATEEEYLWIPEAHRKNIPVTLSTLQSSRARGKILRLQTPECIHAAWSIDVADVWETTGQRLFVYDDYERTTIKSGYPKSYPDPDAYPMPTLGSAGFEIWTVMPIIESSTITWDVDATTPATVPHGEQIIAAVHSERWRFGLWINDVYRITVP